MINKDFRPAATVLLSFSLVACTSSIDPVRPATAAEMQVQSAPRWISDKRVSTNCGPTDAAADPPPGFARKPGSPARAMPDQNVQRLELGADRPIAETVPDKVSPGITVIDPGYRKPIFLINNEK